MRLTAEKRRFLLSFFDAERVAEMEENLDANWDKTLEGLDALGARVERGHSPAVDEPELIKDLKASRDPAAAYALDLLEGRVVRG